MIQDGIQNNNIYWQGSIGQKKHSYDVTTAMTPLSHALHYDS